MNTFNNSFLIQDIKMLRLKELNSLKNLYLETNKFSEAENIQENIDIYKSFCNYATDSEILQDAKHRLTDYYQILAGYYYTIAEDFPENPYIKIDRLKKAVVCCNHLKQHCKNAEIYTNRYICQKNRNYLR